MKLGEGKNKYIIKFEYLDNGRKTIKNVYADTAVEALDLFEEYYKDYNIEILEVRGELK